MLFPFTIKYTKRIHKGLSDNEAFAALNRIKDLVENKSADEIELKKDELVFRVYPFGLRWNWNIMNPIEKGRIKIIRTDKEVTLTYEIFMFRLATIAIIMSSLMGIVSKDASTGLFAFLLLFCGNWLLAVLMHYMFLEEIFSEVKQ